MYHKLHSHRHAGTHAHTHTHKHSPDNIVFVYSSRISENGFVFFFLLFPIDGIELFTVNGYFSEERQAAA